MATNTILFWVLIWILADFYLSGGLITALAEKAYNPKCTVFGAIVAGLIWPVWLVVLVFRVVGRVWRLLKYRY